MDTIHAKMVIPTTQMDVQLLVELTLDISAMKEIVSNGTHAKKYAGMVMI